MRLSVKDGAAALAVVVAVAWGLSSPMGAGAQSPSPFPPFPSVPDFPSPPTMPPPTSPPPTMPPPTSPPSSSPPPTMPPPTIPPFPDLDEVFQEILDELEELLDQFGGLSQDL